jgi:Tfp pilus assembly protein PilF
LAGVYTNLGIVYERQGKTEEAVQAYQFALKKNPLNFDASNNLGVLLRDQGKFTEAEKVYLDALKQWPHHQDSLLNLGILYDLYMGKLREALANYKLAQRLNTEEDRKLKGWIVDLERRLPAEAAQTQEQGL